MKRKEKETTFLFEGFLGVERRKPKDRKQTEYQRKRRSKNGLGEMKGGGGEDYAVDDDSGVLEGAVIHG